MTPLLTIAMDKWNLIGFGSSGFAFISIAWIQQVDQLLGTITLLVSVLIALFSLLRLILKYLDELAESKVKRKEREIRYKNLNESQDEIN